MVQDAGFRGQDSWFGVQGSGFRVQGSSSLLPVKILASPSSTCAKLASQADASACS